MSGFKESVNVSSLLVGISLRTHMIKDLKVITKKAIM